MNAGVLGDRGTKRSGHENPHRRNLFIGELRYYPSGTVDLAMSGLKPEDHESN